jgi:Asp-tRNA(Asn)/Glu-tRNA(Gln) amidotransferase A subunit family amidase
MNERDRFLFPSAREIALRTARGEVTCEETVRSYLQRIAESDSSISAWEYIDETAALMAARNQDRRGARVGALRGVVVGVKDVFDTADMPTSYGSEAYRDFRPASDASVVALLRRAGGIVLGKTVTTELAAVSPGKTRNPHNGACTPGGSSSGSAAAVAAGMVSVALGTQTSGSTIRPASFCGVVGYKPTFGLIDRTGVKALASSLDTVGVFARSVGDVAFFASVVTARPQLVPGENTGKPRIGVYKTAHWDRADPDTCAAMAHASDRLGKAGFALRDVSVPLGFDGLLALHDTVMGYEINRCLAFERWFKSEKISDKTKAFIDSGQATISDAYDAAKYEVATLRRRLDELFENCDVLLTPASTGAAPRGLESTGDPTFNRSWTLLHTPCMTLPAHKTPGGLPVGVQFVGRLGEDARLLAACAAVEDALAT